MAQTAMAGLHEDMDFMQMTMTASSAHEPDIWQALNADAADAFYWGTPED